MQIGIKYAGKKPRPQTDTVAGTNLVWIDSEQVHFVSESIAARLLAHPDVWSKAGVKDGEAAVETTPVAAKKLEDEHELAPLVPLEVMPKAELINFAQRQFGQKLKPQMSEENMRRSIRNWMNSPTIGG